MEPLSRQIPKNVDDLFKCLYKLKKDDNFILNALVTIGGEFGDVRKDKYSCYVYHLPIVRDNNYDILLRDMNSGSEKSFGAFSILIDYMRDLANYSCYTAERFEETFLTKIPNYQDIIKIKNISIHEISIILNLFNNIYGIAYSNVERNYPSPKTIYMDGASIIANNYHVALAYSPKIFEYNSYVDVPADFKCSFEKAFSVYVHGPYEKNKYINPDNQTYYDQFYEKYYNIYSPGSKQFTLKSPDDILRK